MLDVMVAHGCTPDVGLFLGSVGTRLAPRFFSISSSNRAHPGHVHITAAVVAEDKPYNGGTLEGVCTHYLARLQEGDSVAIFLRQSAFRLPKDPAKPVVMVGPGTGLAPFRAFLQERVALQEGGSTLGPALTFFGCRRPDSDFIYEEEMREFERAGVTQLQVAFSRVGGAKRYVQHDLAERGREVWQWLSGKRGYMYVCGDAKHMAKVSMFLSSLRCLLRRLVLFLPVRQIFPALLAPALCAVGDFATSAAALCAAVGVVAAGVCCDGCCCCSCCDVCCLLFLLLLPLRGRASAAAAAAIAAAASARCPCVCADNRPHVGRAQGARAARGGRRAE